MSVKRTDASTRSNDASSSRTEPGIDRSPRSPPPCRRPRGGGPRRRARRGAPPGCGEPDSALLDVVHALVLPMQDERGRLDRPEHGSDVRLPFEPVQRRRHPRARRLAVVAGPASDRLGVAARRCRGTRTNDSTKSGCPQPSSTSRSCASHSSALQAHGYSSSHRPHASVPNRTSGGPVRIRRREEIASGPSHPSRRRPVARSPRPPSPSRRRPPASPASADDRPSAGRRGRLRVGRSTRRARTTRGPRGTGRTRVSSRRARCSSTPARSSGRRPVRRRPPGTRCASRRRTSRSGRRAPARPYPLPLRTCRANRRRSSVDSTPWPRSCA